MDNYYQKLAHLLAKGNYQRKTITEGEDLGQEGIFADEKLLIATRDNLNFSTALGESIMAKPHLLVFGGGHISLALYQLARLQNMEMTVFDDREEFANQERFPEAEIVCAPFEQILAQKRDISGAYYVIVTSGHSYDRQCLAYALRQQHQYVGMIGSKEKIALTYEKLKKQGYSEQELQGVFSPIGLDIGGDTPQEIAISIMAQIISVYAKDKHRILIDSQLINQISLCTGKAIVVRVLSKNGSTPATPGATMLVSKNRILGTVGGGALEKKAIEDAQKATRNFIKEYDLSNGSELGMACGGRATLLFTMIYQ
ncbi:MAG: XdhC family protein [Sphaerochaetaceae bacterium]